MLQFENLAEFSQGLDQWIADCEDLADGALRGLAVEAFDYILLGTPEWSGNLASAWRLTVGVPASGYGESIFKQTGWTRLRAPGDATPSPYSRAAPNEEALAYARSIAKESLPLIHTSVEVFITNTAPYALDVERNVDHQGKAFIRLINLPIEMVHAAAAKFGAIGEISEARAKQLAGRQL